MIAITVQCANVRLLYNEKVLRTINFAVFMDFTATLKSNPQKSYSTQIQ